MPGTLWTLVIVNDEISGPLRAFIRSPFGSGEDQARFVIALKERAEILG